MAEVDFVWQPNSVRGLPVFNGSYQVEAIAEGSGGITLVPLTFTISEAQPDDTTIDFELDSVFLTQTAFVKSNPHEPNATTYAETAPNLNPASEGYDIGGVFRVVIPAGQTSATYQLQVVADHRPENDESFDLFVTHVSGDHTTSDSVQMNHQTIGSFPFGIYDITDNYGLNTFVIVDDDPAFASDGTFYWLSQRDDTFFMQYGGTTLPVKAGAGKDNVQGSTGADVVYGGEDHDALFGYGGNDTLYGGDWDDDLMGGDGADALYGGIDNDHLYGGDGNDVGYGDDGIDGLWGENGNDLLYGGAGSDTLYGGDGDDALVGGDVNFDLSPNTLSGGAGNDLLVGGGGADTIHGDAGADVANGGGGADTLYGESGDDVLFGAGGADSILGQDGDDILLGDDNTGGPGGNDAIDGGAGNDMILGQGGNDVLFGESGDDAIAGGDGNDVIYGHQGADILFGEAGDDVIAGGEGGDILKGGLGADTFVFDAGDNGDTILDLNEGGVRDRFDLRPILDAAGYAGTTPRADGLLAFYQNGVDTDVYLLDTFLFRVTNVYAPALDDSYFVFQ